MPWGNELARLLVLVAILGGCSWSQGGHRPAAHAGEDYKDVALRFATALARRDYASAYAMTSKQYQSQTSLLEMRSGFERIAPTDSGGIRALGVSETLTDWAAKQEAEVGWAYVPLVFELQSESEAVAVVVALEDGQLRISKVEFGRP